MRIDLHTHSNRSDGTDTPAELVAHAIASGLDVIALTDHDTTAGWAEAARAVRELAEPGSFRLVPGAELSCTCPNGRGQTVMVHLLAYLFDPDSPAIVHEQRRLRVERRSRLHAMACLMADAGFPVDPDELLAGLPPDAPGGRPHLARMLIAAGVVDSVSEAFERYIGTRGRFYLPREQTPVHRALEMIRKAGGVTVLAHPFGATRGPMVSMDTIGELAEQGLAGVEVDHPEHNPATRADLRALAADLDLIPTGSSDYHGSNKTVRIGQETTPPDSLRRLVERCDGCDIIG